jgi:hypothetical protein
MKPYKIRVFYNAYKDVEISAANIDELKEKILDLDAKNVNLQYDFYESLEDDV